MHVYLWKSEQSVSSNESYTQRQVRSVEVQVTIVAPSKIQSRRPIIRQCGPRLYTFQTQEPNLSDVYRFFLCKNKLNNKRDENA
jgi:hypothetical protein